MRFRFFKRILKNVKEIKKFRAREVFFHKSFFAVKSSFDPVRGFRSFSARRVFSPRTYCFVNAKGRSVYNHFRLSRHEVRYFFRSGFLYGVVKAS